MAPEELLSSAILSLLNENDIFLFLLEGDFCLFEKKKRKQEKKNVFRELYLNVSGTLICNVTFLGFTFFFVSLPFYYYFFQMSNVLKRPARRKKLKQREETDEEQENRFVDQFQQIKKRRVERKENVKTINMVRFTIFKISQKLTFLFSLNKNSCLTS